MSAAELPAMPGQRRYGGVVAVLAFLGVVASAMQVLIIPILGQLGPLLGTTARNAAWSVTVTPLVSAVTVAVSGRLGDMLGKRVVIIAVTIPMVVGLAVCAMANNLVWMLVGRGLQGVAIGVIPLSISLLRDVAPPKRLAVAVAIMSAAAGVGNAIGLPTAAAIAQATNWHIMFWVFAGLALVGLLLLITLVPRDPASAPTATAGQMRPRFDFAGAIILACGLVALLLPVSKGADWGWTSPPTLALFGVAVVFIAIWAVVELHHPAPLTNLRTLARPAVAWTNIASVLATFAMYVRFLVLPQILQLAKATGYGLGQSMLAMSRGTPPAGTPP